MIFLFEVVSKLCLIVFSLQQTKKQKCTSIQYIIELTFGKLIVKSDCNLLTIFVGDSPSVCIPVINIMYVRYSANIDQSSNFAEVIFLCTDLFQNSSKLNSTYVVWKKYFVSNWFSIIALDPVK